MPSSQAAYHLSTWYHSPQPTTIQGGWGLRYMVTLSAAVVSPVTEHDYWRGRTALLRTHELSKDYVMVQ